MAPGKSITSSSPVSGSETGSECVSSTVIPSPYVVSSEIRENPAKKSPEKIEVERSENPAENDEKPPCEEKPKKSVRIQDSDEEEDDDDQSSKVQAHLKPSPSVHVMESHHEPEISANRSINSDNSSSGGNALVEEAWENLKKSVVLFNRIPVGTLAALDHSVEALNYNQVFVRDFVPSGLAYMMQPKPELQIVKNFLLKTLHLQSWEKKVDNFTLSEGVMPASFKVLPDSPPGRDTLKADFGGSAIGRVAPVDSGFWWIIMLRSYTKCSQDYTLVEMPEMQRGIRLILNLCLSDGFDTFPTLLCADGCSMIDRRMGVYGYPIEIQALFYFALRCAHQMLKPERGGKELLERIEKRIIALRYHIQTYFWLDHTQLNNIYRYKTEEYSHTAVNKFNVIPDSIPEWVFDFMPLRGGYFIGNVSPARMDFRWFLIGNCIAILSSLATPEQETAIMDLFEERWEDLIGEMPLKIAYPALEGSKWRIVTGCDPKNTSWSYHNGGSWPVLIWLFTAACIKSGRRQIAKRAIELAEKRLSKDGWPEYYDGKTGRFIGKQARKLQTCTISGYLVAKQMIENPTNVFLISLEKDFIDQPFKPQNPMELFDFIEGVLKLLLTRAHSEGITMAVPVLKTFSEVCRFWKTVVESEDVLRLVAREFWGQHWRRDIAIASKQAINIISSCSKSFPNFRRANGNYSRTFWKGARVCSCIATLDSQILCGFSDGSIILFEVIDGTLKKDKKKFPPQNGKYAVIGIIPIPGDIREAVYGTLDGSVFCLQLNLEVAYCIHLGNGKEGTLIDFGGNQHGWVALYSGGSFRVWNKFKEVVYMGGDAEDKPRKVRIVGIDVLICTFRRVFSFTLTNPSVIDKTFDGGLLVVSTFSANNQEFAVVNTSGTAAIMRVSDFAVVNTFETRGTVYGAMNTNFGLLANVGGELVLMGLREPSRMRMQPQLTNIIALSADDSRIVASSAGLVHLWQM